MNTDELPAAYEGKTAFQLLEELSEQFTGHTSNPFEAFQQWEAERVALAELFDENQALIISFRRYDISMTLAERIIAKVEQDAGMFISQETRDKIEKFREQIKAIQNYRILNRELIVDAANRRHNVTANANP